MRPQEKWMKNPKDPNEKKKRAYRPKSKRVAAKKGQDDDSKSNAPEPNSEGSSPADGATEAELEGEDENQRLNTDMIDPQLRSLGGNAPNAEPTGIVQGDAPVDGPSTRPPTGASQSSPDQTEGSHTHPVEGDLTPKPLRRQLFPSPTNKPSPNSQAPVTKDKSAKPLSELPNICRRSPRINKTVDVLNTNPETPKASNKENQFSRTADDDLHDLFNDEEDGFQLPPQTPTPTRRSDRLLLKTPSRTPSGGNPVTRSISANDRPPLQEVKTPKRDFIMGSNRTVEEMTPFTRMIHEELIKNAPKAKKANSNNNTPNSQLAQSQQSHKSDLNFSDLPTLDVSPMSMSRQPAFASLDRDTMDFGGVEFSDLFARPAGPGTGSGSPPDGYYHFLNEDFLGAGWVGMGGGQGQPRGEGKNGHGEEGGLGVSQPQIQSPPLRRSPRRNR